jgi:hypothetical protein
MPVRKERLNIISRGVDRLDLAVFSKLIGILKEPVALEDLSFPISYSISLFRTGDIMYESNQTTIRPPPQATPGEFDF